jgi:hypothetical protein
MIPIYFSDYYAHPDFTQFADPVLAFPALRGKPVSKPGPKHSSKRPGNEFDDAKFHAVARSESSGEGAAPFFLCRAPP